MGKVIWKSCKKLKFDDTTQWYKHKPESVLENETYKILWDFEIQKDCLIPAWRPDPVTINKRRENLPSSRLCCPGGQQSVHQRKPKERQVLGPWRRTEKAMDDNGDCDTNCNWHVWNDLQGLFKGLEEL